jgi:membrane protein DedA with SNARE-associated domain
MGIFLLLAAAVVGLLLGYFFGAWLTRKKTRKMNELQPLIGVVLPPKEN